MFALYEAMCEWGHDGKRHLCQRGNEREFCLPCFHSPHLKQKCELPTNGKINFCYSSSYSVSQLMPSFFFLANFLSNKTATGIKDTRGDASRPSLLWNCNPTTTHWGKNPPFIQNLPRIWCSKCEFCEKWDFQNVNFVKNEILKMWIL